MELLLSRFSAQINSDIFLKNPENSALGIKIIQNSITLIDEIGMEEFTFRKLALKTGTTEATVYRYFENKHKLLLYLSSWYWGWVEYHLVIKNSNITSHHTRLRHAIDIVARPYGYKHPHYDIDILFRIICRESSKAYLVKEVDSLNRNGVFYNYKNIVAKISAIIQDINPQYQYPHMLVTTIIEGIHHQVFFAEHLPSLTDKNQSEDYLTAFYYHMAISLISQNN